MIPKNSPKLKEEIPINIRFFSIFCLLLKQNIYSIIATISLFVSMPLFATSELVFRAIYRSDLPAIQKLVEEGADPDSRDEKGRTPLILATQTGKLPLVEYFLSVSKQLDTQDFEERAAIHYAIQLGRLDILAKILERKPNLEIKEEKNYSPIGLCILAKNLKCVEMLHRAGARMNSFQSFRYYPLSHLAVVQKNEFILQYLLEVGLDFDLRESEGLSLLHRVVLSNDLNLLKLVRSYNLNLEVLSEDGETPLLFALDKKLFIMGEALLEMGANPFPQNKTGKNALHYFALHSKGLEMIQKIAKKYGRIDEKDKEGFTPLGYAVKANLKENVATFLALGAKADLLQGNGETLIHDACRMGNIRMVKQLLEAGANPNSINANGDPPIFYAIDSGNEAIVDILLNSGVNTGTRNKEKETILTRSISIKNLRMLEFLLKKNIDLNSIDNEGNNLIIEIVSSTKIAEDSKNLEKALKILNQYGTNFNAKNKYGVTALEKTILKSNLNLVKVLVQFGSEVNEPDKSGNTPLKKAILNYVNSNRNQEENIQIIEYLLNKGASVNLTDRNKRVILSDLIVMSNSENISKVVEMVNLLLKKGARTKLPDSKGKSAFDYAKESNYPSIFGPIQLAYNKEKDPGLSRDWTNIQFGTSGIDVPLALDSDSNGNHIVLGKFENESRLIRLDARGKALWQRDFFGATGAGVDSLGNIFILGTVPGTLENWKNGCQGGQGFVQSLIKVDAEGNDLFEKFYGKESSCTDSGSGGVWVTSKGIYLAFYYGEETEIQFVDLEGKKVWSKSFAERQNSIKPLDDGILLFGNKFIQLDTRGNPKTILDAAKYPGVKDIAISKTGDMFLVGQMQDNSSQGIYIEKRDRNLRLIWKKQIATETRDIARFVALDDQGNLFIVGETMGEMHGSPKLSPENFLDYFIVKLDTMGRRLWTTQVGSDANDYLNLFQLSQKKFPILAGSSSGRVPGGTYQGGEDIIIFKLNEEGEPF